MWFGFVLVGGFVVDTLLVGNSVAVSGESTALVGLLLVVVFLGVESPRLLHSGPGVRARGVGYSGGCSDPPLCIVAVAFSDGVLMLGFLA